MFLRRPHVFCCEKFLNQPALVCARDLIRKPLPTFRDHAPLSRLLQALQNCGHFIPFSTVPAFLASFHSAPHFFSRSRMASMAALAGLLALASVLSGAAAGAGAYCVNAGKGVDTRPAASTAAKTVLVIDPPHCF